MSSTVWKVIALLVAFGAGCASSYFVGDYHGKGVEDAKWNKERVATAQAVATELADQKQQADAYKAQLQTADEALNAVAAELARATNAPIPNVLCHRASGGGSGTMSTGTGKTDDSKTGSGVINNMWGPEFDPATILRNLHTAFSEAYASCLDALNRWPN